MNVPVVAIVGRPNVGKSTLLNRLAGRRIAVVADLPGTTRDRIFAAVSWEGRDLTVVDTGGWQANPQSSLEQKVRYQVEAAIAQADAIILLVDGREGPIAADEEIADWLRQADRPTMLVVNKVDSPRQAEQVPDFHRLGMAEPVAISAYHNRGIRPLMDTLLAALPEQPEITTRSEQTRLAIVGRPNVGKSTLLNALLGDERAIVDDSPGTTRDSLDAVIRWHSREIVLIDTAGIKRRGRVEPGIDYYSLLRALQAINRCDVALLLVDAGEFITAQDTHIAGYVIEAGKGMMLAVNKWDLVPEEHRREFKQKAERRFRFAPYTPIVYISAQMRQGVSKILPQAWEIWQERQKRVPQSEVSALVKEATATHPPPRSGSRRLRILRAYQDEAHATTFVFEVNDPGLIHFSYHRYLENRLREDLGFSGVPLRLLFTKAKRKMDDKTQVRAK
jgi:GTPase